jgi:hypothetical protein
VPDFAVSRPVSGDFSTKSTGESADRPPIACEPRDVSALRCAVVLSLLIAAGGPARANSEVEDSCGADEVETGCVEDEDAPPPAIRVPNYTRASSEIGGSVLFGAGWYWYERDRQVADWDFPSWRDRFSLDIFVNDNNPFAINYVWHTVSGAGFHVFARSNDIGFVPSALLALAGSLSWEYGVEFRERISVNDIIFTASAGLPAGELFYLLGEHLQQGPATIPRRLGRWTVGLPRSAHNALDGRSGHRGPKIAGRFHLSYGLGAATGEGAEDEIGHQVRLTSELAVGDDHLAPGRRSDTFRETNFTRFEVELGRGPATRTSRFAIDALFAGWRRQSIPEAGEGELGTALAFGVAGGVRYRNDRFGSWRDRVGQAHLPGPGIDADLIGDGWRLRGHARLSVDYAGIHALALDRWYSENPDEVGKTVLAEQGYYYAWGGSGRVGVELASPSFALGADSLFGLYHSNEGLDRLQEDLTVDQRARDRVMEYRLWMRAAIRGPVFIEARTSGIRRHERFEDLTATAGLVRHTLELGFRFE